MISKKICMLGAFAVGKTSLVAQYVHSVFSDKYLSTVGVKISKKTLAVDGCEINLLLWDLEGKDLYVDVNTAYLRGAMGVFVVADGTRKETLETALELRAFTLEQLGPIPHCLLINKADIADQWEITPTAIAELQEKHIKIFRTSAKTGHTVEEAFRTLATDMLQEQRHG